MEKLLDAELAKSLELEQHLEGLKRRLHAAEEKASVAEGGYVVLLHVIVVYSTQGQGTFTLQDQSHKL